MKNNLSIEEKLEGNKMYFALSGQIDANTAGVLNSKMDEVPEQVDSIYFDFANLDYIASAGLRVLFRMLDYTRKKGGEMKVENYSQEVLEVFRITGFHQLLKLED